MSIRAEVHDSINEREEEGSLIFKLLESKHSDFGKDEGLFLPMGLTQETRALNKDPGMGVALSLRENKAVRKEASS